MPTKKIAQNVAEKNIATRAQAQQTKVLETYSKKVNALAKKLPAMTKQAARNKAIQLLEEARDLAQLSLVTAGMTSDDAAAALTALDKDIAPAPAKTVAPAPAPKPAPLSKQQKKTKTILDAYVDKVLRATSANVLQQAEKACRDALSNNDEALVEIDGLMAEGLALQAEKTKALKEGKPALEFKSVPEVKQITEKAKTEKAPMLHKSLVDSPVAAMWALCNSMIGERRKDVIAEAVKRGIATCTAKTQFQAWFSESKKASKGNASK